MLVRREGSVWFLGLRVNRICWILVLGDGFGESFCSLVGI